MSILLHECKVYIMNMYRWLYIKKVTNIQSLIIDLSKNQKYAFDSKSYFIRESNSQDKSLKFGDSVHLKYCLYMTKHGHWRLALSRSLSSWTKIHLNWWNVNPDLLLYWKIFLIFQPEIIQNISAKCLWYFWSKNLTIFKLFVVFPANLKFKRHNFISYKYNNSNSKWFTQ